MGKICTPILYEKKEECCGCTACYSICSHSAITMIEDEEGFLYPQVDVELCKASSYSYFPYGSRKPL